MRTEFAPAWSSTSWTPTTRATTSARRWTASVRRWSTSARWWSEQVSNSDSNGIIAFLCLFLLAQSVCCTPRQLAGMIYGHQIGRQKNRTRCTFNYTHTHRRGPIRGARAILEREGESNCSERAACPLAARILLFCSLFSSSFYFLCQHRRSLLWANWEQQQQQQHWPLWLLMNWTPTLTWPALSPSYLFISAVRLSQTLYSGKTHKRLALFLLLLMVVVINWLQHCCCSSDQYKSCVFCVSAFCSLISSFFPLQTMFTRRARPFPRWTTSIRPSTFPSPMSAAAVAEWEFSDRGASQTASLAATCSMGK